VSSVPIYARAGVKHVWLIEPIARTVEVLRLEGDKYVIQATFADDARVRAEPFDAIELDLAVLWADIKL
jgi:Uma2 family endonuclease